MVVVLHLDNDKILDIRITCLCLYRKELSLILDLVTTETHVSIRVYQNNSFFLDLACIFIWHVYWPYKVPCKISVLGPQIPCMATTFCKWILTIKNVI